tara:strand:+ start:6023 stop:9076 length:3054 start_codon:yes stop_codon:yes gene_type:complete
MSIDLVIGVGILRLKRIKRWLFKSFNWVDADDLELLNSSVYFDHDWYKSNLKELELYSRKDLVSHYLLQDPQDLYNPSEKFDSKWYLEQYSDVNVSKINPLLHFLKYGQHEGRLPTNNRATAWESYLWLGSSLMEHKLDRATIDSNSYIEKTYSLWALGRWYYFKGRFSEASIYLREFVSIENAYPVEVEPHILLIQSLIEISAFDDVNNFLTLARSKYGNLSDLVLLECNLKMAIAQKKGGIFNKAWLDGLNSIYKSTGLMSLDVKGDLQKFDLNDIFACKTDNYSQVDGVLVSVIVPTYNAEERIEYVLRSLEAQTWSNIEIIVVDDCSTDLSTTVINKFIKNSTIPITLVELDVNSGPYIARNKGLDFVKGHYITTHDSDDWSHPQKIERQVIDIIRHKGAIGSVSSWARVTEHGAFIPWLTQNKIIHTNISSLMIDRKVLNRVGCWDEIRAGADTEFFFRLVKAFGTNAIVRTSQNTPLALGLVTNESITQSSLYNIRTQFRGVRKKYLSAAQRWHESTTKLFMAAGASHRPFLVPKILDTRSCESHVTNIYDMTDQGGVVDEAWYIENNRDIQDVLIDPVTHFIDHGIAEHRDPSPKTSLSYLAYKHSIDTASSTDRYKFITLLEKENSISLNWLKGKLDYDTNATTILVVGHAASKDIFGAEISLLDVCSALVNLGFNVIVLIPKFSNVNYIENISNFSSKIYIFPYSWFQLGKSVSDVTKRLFFNILIEESVSILHLNSSVILDFAELAKTINIKVVVHLRELWNHDKKLCSMLESEPSVIYNKILNISDLVIANSETTKTELLEFNLIDNVYVVNNIVDSSSLSKIPLENKPKRLTVGIVSDNSEKKGIFDFYKIASLVKQKGGKVDFLIFGPNTPEIDTLLMGKCKFKNITFLGYHSQLNDIYSKFDILLSLSHFQESFGRTILEAMASGRVVISYNWGATSELISNQETGWLVEHGDINQVVDIILEVQNNTSILFEMGKKSIARANENYGIKRFNKCIERAYATLL